MHWIPPPLPAGLFAITVLTVLMAAWHDIRSRKIPNWLVLAALLAGCLGQGLLLGWPGVRSGLLGMVVAFGIYFPLYLLRGMGAGDVKLMAALGAMLGMAHWLPAFALTAVFGAVSGLCLAAAKGRLRSTLFNTGYLIRELISFRAPYLTHEQIDVGHKSALRMPHAVSIAAGTLLMMLLSVTLHRG